MNKKFWLITTEHLKNRLWFRDEEDFKAGMNYVALISTKYPGGILAFVLMSNHVHFVMECTEDNALNFINSFKSAYSKYFYNKYSSKELLRSNKVDLREVTSLDESLERAIAYVQMNCVAANICLHPSGYSWGTGDSFFRETPYVGKTIRNLTGRAIIKMTHSKKTLPADYLVNDRGFIIPYSYVNVKKVEALFRTPKRMNYFLQSSSKAAKTNNLPTMPSFRDQTVSDGLKDFCTSVYGKKHLSELSLEQTSEILKQLRYRFSADPNQISRVSGLPYDTVSKLLEKF